MKRVVLYFVCLFLMTIQAFAQDKTDIVYKTNGEELKGEVKSVDDQAIRFTYSGETLQYTIKKEEINKIVFASGRTEIISGTTAATGAPATTNAAITADRHNKIAILPFSFLTDGQPGEELGLKVQNECFALLSSHSGDKKLLDNHTTNALLIKAGVTSQNIAGYTMDEICTMLGVEYVISGMVTMDKTSQTNYNSNTQSTSATRKKDAGKSSSSSYGSSSSTSTQNYSTTLALNIYNDKGENIYSKDRKAFWNLQDAYKSTLEYLIKRSPVYQK